MNLTFHWLSMIASNNNVLSLPVIRVQSFSFSLMSSHHANFSTYFCLKTAHFLETCGPWHLEQDVHKVQ